jgi:transcriptional regulator with XRE-family HTH domain
MQINEKIKQARVSKSWSQKEIAEKLEESRSTYAEWERNTIPSFDIIVKIAEVTGTSILEFVAAVNENIARETKLDEKPTDSIKLSAEFLAGKLEGKDETIYQIEARRKEAMNLAEKMEAHYKDMAAALERSQTTISEILQPMVSSLKEIPPVLEVIVRNSNEHDREIMKALDHLVGNTPGTLEKESGKRILKSAVEQQRKGKAEAGK